jgi:hypothetical protein
MAELAWWQRGAIYPRLFADSNGDGVGDLRGIASRLDHVAELAVEAIWLSPFFRSPMADFGYDVSDYRDIDPIFGTLADFDHLVEQCHARDIRVVSTGSRTTHRTRGRDSRRDPLLVRPRGRRPAARRSAAPAGAGERASVERSGPHGRRARAARGRDREAR